MKSRSVRALHAPSREDVRDLITRRPAHSLEQIEPFLFINHHGPQVFPPNNEGLPFGPHPHRGFETVTFIVEGSLVHSDSEGHESEISAGGVQWMTAGRGVEHSEMSPADFLERGGPLEILQLWINLPSSLKMTAPKYTGLQKDQIPSISIDGATIRLIAGAWDRKTGPIESLTGITLMSIEMKTGSELTLPAPQGRTVFLYVVRGDISIGTRRVSEFHLIEMNDDGDAIEAIATDDALLIFGHAMANREPIVAYGPFVMNTREEIVQAVRDYDSGNF